MSHTIPEVIGMALGIAAIALTAFVVLDIFWCIAKAIWIDTRSWWLAKRFRDTTRSSCSLGTLR